MRIFLVVLFLLFTACEVNQMADQNTKPDILIFETPDGNVADPPATVISDGYLDGVTTNPLYATEFNKFRREHYRLGNYLLADTRTIYVGVTTGNDTTGDGTFAKPYATIAKAYSMIAPFAYTEISLMESGDYLIAEDIEQRNKLISIVEYYTVTAHVKFGTYKTGLYNEVYEIKTFGYAYLAIDVTNISVNAPTDTGADWASVTRAMAINGGVSKISLKGAIAFSATGATGTALPSLVAVHSDEDNGDVGYPIVSVYGTITTNDNGYVVEDYGQVIVLNNFGSIDNPDYWLGTGGGSLATLYFDVSAYSSTENALTLAIHRLNTAGINPTWDDIAQTIDATDLDSDIQTALETLINTAYPEIPKSAITGTITRDGTNAYILTITITISDDYSDYVLSDIPVVAISATYYHFTYKRGKKNINVQTNITALK